MCSPANRAIIDAVVNDFISSNKPFTAYDVTQEARSRGATERHGDMKNSVHDNWGNMQNQGYQRQVVALNGSPIDPWLYFPQGYNPQDYVDAVNAGNAPPVGSNGSPVAQPDAADDDDDDDTVAATIDTDDTDDVTEEAELTSEERLAIPIPLLNKLGAGKNATVYAVSIPADKKVQIRLDIGPNGVDPANKVMEYDSGSRGEVRISKHVLSNAELSGNKFTISFAKDAIEISA